MIDTKTANQTRHGLMGAWLLSLLAALLAVGLGGSSASGDSLIPRGAAAPPLSLPTLSGETVSLEDLKGRIVLLLFGELYNENSIDAVKEVADVLAGPGMADLNAAAYLIATQKAPAADLRTAVEQAGVTVPVLHDADRSTFATYHVVVLPSLVVVDGEGTVVLACAGYPLDFRDIVTDALFYSAGRLSRQEYERKRAAPGPSVPEEQVRAMRLANLGEQLSRRGSGELAVNSFREAISLFPDCVPARVGLSNCLLRRGELAEAEAQLRHALKVAPESVEASLGLVHVQTARGGDELDAAKERLGELLRKRPHDPRVLYAAAVAAEKAGEIDTALAHYKRAAELLLYGPN